MSVTDTVTKDEVHLAACAYADKRRAARLAGKIKGEQPELTGQDLWLAHYEGYRDAGRERPGEQS